MYFRDIETLPPLPSPCLLYADARPASYQTAQGGERGEGKSEAACVFNTPPPHPPLPSFLGPNKPPSPSPYPVFGRYAPGSGERKKRKKRGEASAEVLARGSEEEEEEEKGTK